MTVHTRHAHPGAVAHAVMRRVEMRGIAARRVAVAMPGAEVRMAAIAVHPRAFDADAVVVMGGGGGVAAAIIAIMISMVAIGAPARHRALLIGRNRREVAGTAIGRALVDIII